MVDPGEARPVKEYLAREGLTLVAILATHHHPDHVGGIAELVAMKKVPVFGPKGEPIPALTNPVGQDDKVRFPRWRRNLPCWTFGHTRAHVAYYGLGSRFCGDTLFACAAGASSRARPPRCWIAYQRAALPDETKVYCGHEYTLANIRFARAVDPHNAVLAAGEERVKRLRDAGRPSLPSTLGEERATNPFLRCAEPVVVEAANKYLGGRVADPVRVFAAIREWKNKF